MHRRTALAAMATAPWSAVASSVSDPTGDVEILRDAFELLHPGLLRYCSPAEVRANLDRLRVRWREDATLDERYLALSRFAATVRCGHTYANFYNQSKPVAGALFERDDCLPFHFRWLDGRMVVTRSLLSDEGLPPGSEVRSINGVASDVILAKLMRLARADGANDAKRVAWLQVQGDDAVEAFDVFQPLCFPRSGGSVRLEAATPCDPTAHRLEVPTMTSAARRACRAAPDKGLPWSLDISDPAMAVLRMSTWALYNSTWNWKEWLDQSFETLATRKATSLAIDLRSNEGGLDVGDVLLSHFVDKPTQLPAPRRLVRYQRVPTDLLPYLDTWDPSFRDWGERVERVDDRFWRFKEDSRDAVTTITPRQPLYRGRVFVLVGPTNSSATFEFASSLRACRRGLLLGEQTGGNLRGINGGAFFFLRLPETGLEIDLPLIGQFSARAIPPDSGLDPDVLVRSTIADVRDHRDGVMDAARELSMRI